MNDLKVTIIQSDLHWEDKSKNLDMFSRKIAPLSEATDLIVLPEMFTTGFSMKPELFAESMTGPTIIWMKEKAKEKNCVITGSFICDDNGKHFNRLVWMNADGSYETYDKRHLFRMGDEDNHYGHGDKKIIVELKGWKICPLICYDLRFPVWARNTRIESSNKTEESAEKKETDLAYDVLIYVASWPERRCHPWKSLLVARAIENQCYTVGVNRIGNDGNDIYHSGDSVVLNFRGEPVSKTASGKESVETITLNYNDLKEFRKMFPVMLDADDFEIR
ncbi:MAG: nitrilase family protein [Bacteroidetes bacterium]|nr:nitrilase family protein [Bacteroidota bacterium]